MHNLPFNFPSIIPASLQDVFEHEPAIERSPHMPHSLLIPGPDILEEPTDPFPVAVYIAMTRSTEHTPCCQVSIHREEALDIHMQILANGFRSRVPAASSIN